ncbi:LysR family transcriptional regulator [Nitrincola alkalilacustris]|uniref:LysR family transcriptional regulator n=1 Tax=Nitrincola alkalilacustris TaxID=1571224 RepID=UPI00124F4CCA|nr:LysR family transcriptional regulator [Nitrincola alkalilacustris]
MKYRLGQMGDYEIKLLRIFATVVECGGFSAAESELNISRSTISVHIANLEARLNLKLCLRGRSGFSLTEEGATIYQSLQQMFENLEVFRATVNNLNARLSGDLRLVFSDTVSMDSRLDLPGLIRELHGLAPDVYVVANVSSMSEIERMIFNEEAEIGFIPSHREMEGLEYHPLYTDICHLYCHNSHPLFKEPDRSITDERLWQYDLVQGGIKQHEKAADQIAGMNIRATAYHYEARLPLILSGQYLGFLPECYAAPYVDSGEIRALVPTRKQFTLGLSAITKSSSRVNKARDLFLSLLQQRFGTTQ